LYDYSSEAEKIEAVYQSFLANVGVEGVEGVGEKPKFLFDI
jgi:hypothetical protein